MSAPGRAARTQPPEAAWQLTPGHPVPQAKDPQNTLPALAVSAAGPAATNRAEVGRQLPAGLFGAWPASTRMLLNLVPDGVLAAGTLDCHDEARRWLVRALIGHDYLPAADVRPDGRSTVGRPGMASRRLVFRQDPAGQLRAGHQLGDALNHSHIRCA